MSYNNWQFVETLFHEAVSLDVKDRNEYLAQMCAGDDLLRSDIESLLTAYESQSELFEQPVFETGLRLLDNNLARSLQGKIIGSYRIGEKLGSGGMGEVYLAEDTRLNRKVALKFLSNAFIDDKWAKRRLVKEAQSAAMLDHPNICMVYGFEEIKGFSFIVMQYVEGKTLAQLIRSRAIASEDGIPMAMQIISALAEAHSHGIIHRDVKPGNIMITSGGQVKVLDFGLAKSIHRNHSTADSPDNTHQIVSMMSEKGLIIGTVAYMSPEQLRAEDLDYRSDIFSLGALLFEMFYGEHPFLRNSDAETISAILTEPPRKTNQSAASFPHGIEFISKKCLAKKKEERYQSIGEILSDLQKIGHKKWLRQLSAPIKTAALTFVFLFMLIAVSAFSYLRAPKAQSLAVLPFINESSDANLDYISDGLPESLIKRISGSSKLTVKPYTQVTGFKTNNDYRAVGQQLGVDAVVTGKIVRRDGQIFLQNTLIRVSNGEELWQETVPFNTSNTLSVENSISQTVISKFEDVSGNKLKKVPAVNQQTDKPEAEKYYLLGRHYWRIRNRDNIGKAIDNFNAAIAADPMFAKAHANLALAYVVQSGVAYGAVSSQESMNKAKAAAREAIDIDNTLAESHAAMALVLSKYEYDWDKAEVEFKRAIELDPDYGQARFWYSEFLLIRGRMDEALEQAKVARQLEPFSPNMDMNVGRPFYRKRQFDEAAAYLNELLTKNPENTRAEYLLGLVYAQKKMYPEALAIFEKLYYGKTQEKELSAAALGFVYAKTGRVSDAQKILRYLDEAKLPPQEKAIVMTGLGEKEKAVEYLEQAYNEHLPTLVNLAFDPLVSDLHAEPKFKALFRLMNFNF